MSANAYLIGVLQKYAPRDLVANSLAIATLKARLQQWAAGCYVTVMDSGSRAKGTAISLASDVDYLVSLKSDCNENSGGLKGIYNSLHEKLSSIYPSVRKQNVSIRLTLNGLQVDVTPARKQPSALSGDHWVYVSKRDTRQQTNIQKHINDVKNSGCTNEIRVMKIWRELNKLDFPSIYLEYLIIDILARRQKGVVHLADNCWYIINELARDVSNPLSRRIVDPANSGNILSDLITTEEMKKIIARAKNSASQSDWGNIVY